MLLCINCGLIGLKVTNVRLPEEVLFGVDGLAGRHGLSRSEVVRQALVVYLHLVENVGTMLRPVSFRVKPVQIGSLRRGDVSVLTIPTGHAVVVGSTSSGGIGAKPLDVLRVEGDVLGRFLARVALMDVLATGAFPVLVSVTLGVEKMPSGNEILAGVKGEVRVVGLDPGQAVMERFEENFGSVQTGAGLTVVGFANEDELRLGKTKPGDLVVAVGLPRVGGEVLSAEVKGEIVDLRNVLTLCQQSFVHDVFPVGGLGIGYEARMMAFGVGRQLEFEKSELDLVKSAGPATVVLVSMDPDKLGDLGLIVRKPLTVVGRVL